MLKDLEPAARGLADYMSELSEQAYHAGWMRGLEYALWMAVVEGPRQYGRLTITEDIIVRLKLLSAKCSGWIEFDDKTEETWRGSNDWRALYSKNIEAMRRYCT